MGVLKEVFGPSKQEMWKLLCSEIGGNFIDGGIWKGDRVEVKYREWLITLDTYIVSTGKSTISYTRIRAPYYNPDGFRFKIYRKSIFSGIGKAFGVQDVEVGYEEFDEDFIIQGNDDYKLKQLFSVSRVRDLIEAQPSICFQVKDDEGYFGSVFPEGVDELYFEVVGVIKDIERLKLLYELFSDVLNQLCLIGSAYEGHAVDESLLYKK